LGLFLAFCEKIGQRQDKAPDRSSTNPPQAMLVSIYFIYNQSVILFFGRRGRQPSQNLVYLQFAISADLRPYDDHLVPAKGFGPPGKKTLQSANR
jgi:hypothetical protein